MKVIDDPAVVDRLMHEMEASLPIPAFPTKELVQTLRRRGSKVHAERILFIKKVFYGGDEGGITCDVTPTRDTREAILVSLTHLRIPPNHPLSHDIRLYQRARVRRLAEPS